MANPNLLNITSVTLSSNSEILPLRSRSNSNGDPWLSNEAKLLLTNPLGSNKVYKITSMIGNHCLDAAMLLPVGISVFTTNANGDGSPSSVKTYLYGGAPVAFYGAQNSTSETPVNCYITYGPPNIPPATIPMIASPSALGRIGFSSMSKMASPDNVFYLTENNSLYAVTRGLAVDNLNGVSINTSMNSSITYSWEEIG